MATTTRFKQINAFASKFERVGHAAHLSWMQRFVERIDSNIIVTMAEDCPAMITEAYEDLAAAVQVEDDCFRIVTRSPLTEQIAEADQTRDNTFVGLRTMVEALGRVGTQAQKEAAPRVLQAMRDYQVSITENYELESTHIAQLIQQLEVSPLAGDCTTLAVTALVAQLKAENQQVQTLIAQRNQEQAAIDPTAMQRARQAADQAYVETVMIVNAFAVTQWEAGESPYDYAIGIINQDEDYYIQHVFPRGMKKLKIQDNVVLSYYAGDTWAKAITDNPTSNEGWAVTDDGGVYYQQQRLLDKQGQPVDAETKVQAGTYSLEPAPDDGPAPAPDGGGTDPDVTPVTPE